VRRLLGTAAAVAALVMAAAAGAADSTAPAKDAVATFASGGFWCTEHDFEDVPGVTKVISGYTGGTTPNPTYHQVGTGTTGHAEAVEVHYDPSKVTYRQLLDTFWHDTDPLDAGGQFCDRGDEYRSEIFYHDEEQKRLAEASKAAIEQSHRFGSKPIVTRIEPAGPFYPAEDYHQGYAGKNPVRYHFYRWNCGRDQRLAELWGADAVGNKVASSEALPKQ
jgi:peptide-methionine (S)-S-oxide reductase